MRKRDKIIIRYIDEKAHNFGISDLHARIRWRIVQSSISYIIYNSSFKKWSVRDPNLKKQQEETKKRIQQEFKKKLGLLVNVVKQVSDLINDGNNARKIFSEIKTAEITRLKKALIKRFAIKQFLAEK